MYAPFNKTDLDKVHETDRTESQPGISATPLCGLPNVIRLFILGPREHSWAYVRRKRPPFVKCCLNVYINLNKR